MPCRWQTKICRRYPRPTNTGIFPLWNTPEFRWPATSFATAGPPENSRGLAHFAESAEQNVPVPLSAAVLSEAITQNELADLVGSRQETISRIESGKQTASVKLVDKIDRVLKKAIGKRKGR